MNETIINPKKKLKSLQTTSQIKKFGDLVNAENKAKTDYNLLMPLIDHELFVGNLHTDCFYKINADFKAMITKAMKKT